jgi:hypothetical protein
MANPAQVRKETWIDPTRVRLAHWRPPFEALRQVMAILNQVIASSSLSSS